MHPQVSSEAGFSDAGIEIFDDPHRLIPERYVSSKARSQPLESKGSGKTPRKLKKEKVFESEQGVSIDYLKSDAGEEAKSSAESDKLIVLNEKLEMCLAAADGILARSYEHPQLLEKRPQGSQVACCPETLATRSAKKRYYANPTQVGRLVAVFREHRSPSEFQLACLAEEIDMPLKSVASWFKNRRVRGLGRKDLKRELELEK